MTAHLVVVGGGITGLAAARAALRAGARVTLLEASERLGGKIHTEVVDGVPWEWGPDAIVASKPRGRDLLEELGLMGEAVAPATGKAYLLHEGRLKPLPPTAMGVPKGMRAALAAVRAGILSPWGALRVMAEPLIPRLRRGDREIDGTVLKRLGREVHDRLVQPLLGGVFGDASSLAAAMPDLDTGHSLVLAARRREPVRFLGLRSGMGSLVDAFVRELEGADVRTGVHVRSLQDICGAMTLHTDDGPLEADRVLLAVPGPVARNLLVSLGVPGRAVGEWGFTSSAVAHLEYPADAIGQPLDAAGWVAARGEPRIVSACSWVSSKWPREDERGVRLRAVAVGADPRSTDDELLERMVAEVGEVMRASGAPSAVRLHRWPLALPSIGVGHAARVARLRAALPDLIGVAGATWDGVGIPDCVASGEREAARLLGGESS